MSWDIMIFSLKQKVATPEEISDDLFVPVDFDAVLVKHIKHITAEDDHREIKGDNYSINYFVDSEPKGYLMINLYGENALFELIMISKINGWQIFDTGNGQMIDLDHPEKNGYQGFQNYLSLINRK